MLTIGVLPGNVNAEHVMQIMHGICLEAEQHDVRIVSFMGIRSSDYDRTELGGDPASFLYDYQADVIYDYAALPDIDGLIISRSMIEGFMSEKSRDHFRGLSGKIPTVFTDENAPVDGCSSVITENYHAEYDLTAHIIKTHNRKHITVLAGPRGNADAEERLRAVTDCCRDLGMPLEDKQIAFGDFSPNVIGPMEALMRDNPQMDAIIAANDEMADAAAAFLRKKGIKIGEDISVTGFDDDPGIAPLGITPFTTAHQDAEKIGRKAVELVLDMIAGNPPRKEQIGADLVFRASCGCELSKDNTTYVSNNTRSVQARYRVMHERAMQMLTFARDMILMVNDDEQFFGIAAKHLKKFGCAGAWLAILPSPVIHRREQQWVCPETLYLKASVDENGIRVYGDDECPEFSSAHGYTELIDDNRHRSLFVMPLYSGERQYGLIIADIDISNLFYCFLATLQIVSALEYRLISREMDEKNKWLEVAAQTDPMTKALNRRGFHDIAEYAIRSNHGRPMRLYFADMDHLKQINDTFGHNDGDYAIMMQISFLKRVFFKPTQTIARYGGDEFLILDSDPGVRSAQDEINKLKTFCRNFNTASNKPYYIEISCGCTEFIADETTVLADLIDEADKALYESKRSRRASVIRENT